MTFQSESHGKGVSFFTWRGLPKIGGGEGIRYLLVDQKRGSKDFFKIENGGRSHLYF